MKYLIAGLGNIGNEYANTRHNIGFQILDALASASNVVFEDRRLGALAEIRHKARQYVLLKPATYMNRSGQAINYWLQKEKLDIKNLLVIVDDLALPFGTVRLKTKGGSGGHNGLSSIEESVGHSDYARLRFGIGNDFPQGRQVDYVLGDWTSEEAKSLPDRIKVATEMIFSFGTIGAQLTMTKYNNK